MSTKCPDCGKHISKCVCQPTLSSDVLEAVPEWGVALQERVAALEPKYEQCPDCKQLLERVATLELLNGAIDVRVTALQEDAEERYLVEKGLGP